MRTLGAILIAVGVTGLLCSCGTTEEEPDRKPVPPPTSEAGYMPWNRPMPGEGTSQFGGAFDRR